MALQHRNRIIHGDALERLRDLDTASIDCVVTSPPYFRLRDYQVGGQLGLENHVDQWVEGLRAVFRESARVLVPTGTLWLNLGDSFSTHPREGAPRKSLLLAPERLALALVEDGWTIRNKVVWHKTNTVPTSVRDRLATKYEVIYLLTRSTRYYFDLDAIRQPHVTKPRKAVARTLPQRRSPQRAAHLGPNSDGDAGLRALHVAGLPGHPLGKNPGDVWSLSVSGFRGAHFATFPEHLVERILLAGCPELRCSGCRAPWMPGLDRQGQRVARRAAQPTCACDVPAQPGLVLDPFIGSGTTALVAESLKRDWLGIELSPAFITMAEERITAARGAHGQKEAA
jgi:site-specific DNA-methyltransferase (adenine-specific)